jgi:hypothetical protein
MSSSIYYHCTTSFACARVLQAGCRRTFWGGDCIGRNKERHASSSRSKSVSRTYPASHTQQEEEEEAAVAFVEEEGAAAPHLEEEGGETGAAAPHWGSPWSSDAESCSACNVVANLNLAFQQHLQQHIYNFCDAKSRL